MSTRRKQRARGNRSAEPGELRFGSESQPVEFLTVAWLLTVMTTLLCELGWVALVWYLTGRVAPRLELLAGMLLFAAFVLGVLSLVMLPFVWRWRRVRPPVGLVVFAAVVGAAPLILIVIQVMR